jgi:hypothetical protein
MTEMVDSQAPSYNRAASDATTIPATEEEILAFRKTFPQKAHVFSGWSGSWCLLRVYSSFTFGDSSKMDGFAQVVPTTKMIEVCKKQFLSFVWFCQLTIRLSLVPLICCRAPCYVEDQLQWNLIYNISMQ